MGEDPKLTLKEGHYYLDGKPIDLGPVEFEQAPTDIKRAHHIWLKANVPGTEPLDDKLAAALAHDVSWVCTWYQADSEITSAAGAEIVYLNDVARFLHRSHELLLSGNPGKRRLERYYLGPDLGDVAKLLAAISKAAFLAVNERRSSSKHIKSPAGLSAADRCILNLATLYERYTDRKAAVARKGEAGSGGGGAKAGLPGRVIGPPK